MRVGHFPHEAVRADDERAQRSKIAWQVRPA